VTIAEMSGDELKAPAVRVALQLAVFVVWASPAIELAAVVKVLGFATRLLLPRLEALNEP
jgi:hypothetical protein